MRALIFCVGGYDGSNLANILFQKDMHLFWDEIINLKRVLKYKISNLIKDY